MTEGKDSLNSRSDELVPGRRGNKVPQCSSSFCSKESAIGLRS